jgi:hypothetical protein
LGPILTRIIEKKIKILIFFPFFKLSRLMKFDPISSLERHELKPLGHKILQQKLYWNLFIESLHMPMILKLKRLACVNFKLK